MRLFADLSSARRAPPAAAQPWRRSCAKRGPAARSAARGHAPRRCCCPRWVPVAGGNSAAHVYMPARWLAGARQPGLHELVEGDAAPNHPLLDVRRSGSTSAAGPCSSPPRPRSRTASLAGTNATGTLSPSALQRVSGLNSGRGKPGRADVALYRLHRLRISLQAPRCSRASRSHSGGPPRRGHVPSACTL